MGIVQRIGEGLARRTTRRHGVKMALGGLFGTAAAWAVEGPFGSGALAERCVIRYESESCSPPRGWYCNDPSVGGDPSYCDGAKCAGDCQYYDYWYPQPRHTSCWCSAIQKSGGEHFYYKCCDCLCELDGETEACGCKGKVMVDWSRPDKPEPKPKPKPKRDRPRRRNRD